MFFQFNENGLTEIKVENINSDLLTAGYVTVRELNELSRSFGFADSTVEACETGNDYFRSGVEIYDDYTFTELRIISSLTEDEDCVALYFKKNFMLVVDVDDRDGSTKAKFMSAMKRFSGSSSSLEKLIYAFFDALIADENKSIEKMSTEISQKEEKLMENSVEKDFNASVLETKKLLLKLHNYYEQILDITDVVDENENGIFNEDMMMYISNLSKKTERLKEDTDSLKNSLEHLQDAYSSYLDMKMNTTMKIFTVLTSIFFPLTIIVGWYGMNFQSMPEFTWKYGYIYVILLSVITVSVLIIIGKKKKWF